MYNDQTNRKRKIQWKFNYKNQGIHTLKSSQAYHSPFSTFEV